MQKWLVDVMGLEAKAAADVFSVLTTTNRTAALEAAVKRMEAAQAAGRADGAAVDEAVTILKDAFGSVNALKNMNPYQIRELLEPAGADAVAALGEKKQGTGFMGRVTEKDRKLGANKKWFKEHEATASPIQKRLLYQEYLSRDNAIRNPPDKTVLQRMASLPAWVLYTAGGGWLWHEYGQKLGAALRWGRETIFGIHPFGMGGESEAAKLEATTGSSLGLLGGKMDAPVIEAGKTVVGLPAVEKWIEETSKAPSLRSSGPSEGTSEGGAKDPQQQEIDQLKDRLGIPHSEIDTNSLGKTAMLDRPLPAFTLRA